MEGGKEGERELMNHLLATDYRPYTHNKAKLLCAMDGCGLPP